MYHVRAFPNTFQGLRADGIDNLDLKILRRFNILPEERLKVQFNVDMLNAVNHTNFSAPVTDPRSTNFGKVTSRRGLGRLIQAASGLCFERRYGCYRRNGRAVIAAGRAATL